MYMCKFSSAGENVMQVNNKGQEEMVRSKGCADLQQDVGGVQVAMNEAVGVQVSEAGGDVGEDGDDAAGMDAAVLCG